ncbi:TRAP transporter small permease subunit [Ramlibacter sp.]|uniref:TRAP transporter small permease subunit n=1 Tax=Ramlibacter sp. TaxID=1917967 RepID=UPI0039C8EDD0
MDAPALSPARQAPAGGAWRAALDGLFGLAGWLGAACIALMCLLMVGQSVGRQFGWPTGAVNDLVAWLCAAAAFLTMAHAFKHGDFVRVTLLLERCAPAARRRYELGCLALAVAAVAYLAFWACRFTWQSWQFHEVAQGVWAVPIWIPQLSFAAGSLLFLLAVADEFVIVLRGGEPTFVRLVRERHAQGDFSSDV